MARRRLIGVPPVVERWPRRYEHVLTLGQDERPAQSFGALPSPAPPWVSGHWKPLKPGNFGWLGAISDMLLRREILSRTPLPYLGTGERLLIASDAAGDHATPYKVYAFLVTAEASLRPWAEAVAEMRSTWLSQRGPMSFKDLNDGCRARALVPFLKTANEIPGFLLVVAMNKAVGKLLDKRSDRWLFSEIAHWKPAVREELFRSICLVSLLSSGFARPGQDLLWVSDDDDIVANPDRMRAAVSAMSRMVFGLASHPTGRSYLTTPARNDSNQKLEDLLAIPDLAAGAVFNALRSSGEGNPANFALDERAGQIVWWLVNGTRLATSVVLLERAKDATLKIHDFGLRTSGGSAH